MSTHDGLYALNKATGDVQWKLESSSFAISSPAVADSTVYMAVGEHIYALE